MIDFIAFAKLRLKFEEISDSVYIIFYIAMNNEQC